MTTGVITPDPPHPDDLPPPPRQGLPKWAVGLLAVGGLAVLVGLMLVLFGGSGDDTGKVGKLSAFTAADAHFKADFPNKPKRSDQQVPAGETSLRLIQYTSELDADTGFSVGWFQLPQAPAESAVRGFLEATENGSVAAIKGKLLDSSFTTIDGHPAVEYLSTGPGGHFVRSRTILIGKDVYVLQVVSKTRQAPKYKEFIDSFKVV